MNTQLDCFPCILRQALQSARFAGADQISQQLCMREALRRLLDASADESSLDITSDVFEMVRKQTGVRDPYASAKAASEAEALKFLPTLREQLNEAEDGLELAMKIAAIGNIMDYGALADFDVSALLEKVHEHEFSVNVRPEFEARLKGARTLSYFADNAGESVFDRLFIEYLTNTFPIERVLLIVREAPFLNDICQSDVCRYGIDKWNKVEVLPLAISRKNQNPTSWAMARSSDVLLAKGMANFETYSECDEFLFLFIAKCDLVARFLTEKTGCKVEKGGLVFWGNGAPGHPLSAS